MRIYIGLITELNLEQYDLVAFGEVNKYDIVKSPFEIEDIKYSLEEVLEIIKKNV